MMPHLQENPDAAADPVENAADFCLDGTGSSLFSPEFEQQVTAAATALGETFQDITDPFPQ